MRAFHGTIVGFFLKARHGWLHGDLGSGSTLKLRNAGGDGRLQRKPGAELRNPDTGYIE